VPQCYYGHAAAFDNEMAFQRSSTRRFGSVPPAIGVRYEIYKEGSFFSVDLQRRRSYVLDLFAL